MPTPLPWDERLWLWCRTQKGRYNYDKQFPPKDIGLSGRNYARARLIGRVLRWVRYKVGIGLPIKLGYYTGKTQARHRK